MAPGPREPSPLPRSGKRQVNLRLSALTRNQIERLETALGGQYTQTQVIEGAIAALARAEGIEDKDLTPREPLLPPVGQRAPDPGPDAPGGAEAPHGGGR